jgi:hypothetical protein
MNSRWAIVLAALLLAGCFEDPEPGGGQTSTETDTGDELMLGGSWTGSWLYEGQSGELTLQLYHTGGSSVTGTATFASVDWFPCVTTATLDATLDGDQLTGTLTSDADEFTFDLMVTDDQMQGTYEITAGDCGLGLSGDVGFMRDP